MIRRDQPHGFIILTFLTCFLLIGAHDSWSFTEKDDTGLRFEISFPDSLSEQPLTGRMFLAFAHHDSVEPRLSGGAIRRAVFRRGF